MGTARSLVLEFGSFPAILGGSHARLVRAACGDAAAVNEIRDFRRAMRLALQRGLVDAPLLSSSNLLLDYLWTVLSHERSETVRILYLDARNRLIRDEAASTGTLTSATLSAREVVRRALELNAAGIIVAHNHPSGDPTPSPQDIESTGRLQKAAALFDISVHDHLIVASRGAVSLKASGLLS
ncbi:RadC family protein [Sphingomonas sp. R86521]|uniref:JAB domain-containing protein n=1 Tax=Sphingomonas sp. R86521 TaxID=3093860 RepID=UPI0036D40FB3